MIVRELSQLEVSRLNVEEPSSRVVKTLSPHSAGAAAQGCSRDATRSLVFLELVGMR